MTNAAVATGNRSARNARLRHVYGFFSRNRSRGHTHGAVPSPPNGNARISDRSIRFASTRSSSATAHQPYIATTSSGIPTTVTAMPAPTASTVTSATNTAIPTGNDTST